MQTAQNTVMVAGVQTPLLTAEQLEQGTIITGIAMSHLWEVLWIGHQDSAEKWLFIRKVEGPEPCDNHAMVAYGRGHVCSRCQVRKQDVKDFLPIKPGKARVHVIQPISTGCRKPELYTVYGGVMKSGEVKLFHLAPSRIWNEALPPFPALVPVWTIPDRLRALVQDDQIDVDVPGNPAPTAF